MSATPTPASQPNAFESFLDHIGKGIESIDNAIINIGQGELPVITPLIPPDIAATLGTFVVASATQLAATDAKYTAIGKSNISWSAKAAEAVAVGGEGLLAILAKAGITIATGQLPTILAAIGPVIQNLNLSTVTATPVVASASATA